MPPAVHCTSSILSRTVSAHHHRPESRRQSMPWPSSCTIRIIDATGTINSRFSTLDARRRFSVSATIIITR
ncbi:hypothetical protein BDN72DRAFT_514958 [Pluteus cervinus]|uniref:Uncharacterized protein n=1 Tax=Pluteus cervinus TaxID=181527 RepID=A0ACD3BB37_9AGAR|nr:hypothetical protein BDN72DRAFT_514958 [Pluteus cervinus]